MVEVRFYESLEDELLKYAVIIAKHHDKWVLCKHKLREALECPGGHREEGEDILSCARRELYEETGACEYTLEQICVYSVIRKNQSTDLAEESYGMLYYSEIERFDELPDMEIERIHLLDVLPNNWTYPDIQPKLIERVNEYMKGRI